MRKRRLRRQRGFAWHHRGRTPRFTVALRVLTALCALTLPVAITGANAVESSRAGQRNSAIGVNDVKPTDCAALSLTMLYTGAGTVLGGTTNDLVLGASAAQTLHGGDGDDCILGGAGDDQINGGAGADVCIGGPGTDAFGADCETTVEGDATF